MEKSGKVIAAVLIGLLIFSKVGFFRVAAIKVLERAGNVNTWLLAKFVNDSDESVNSTAKTALANLATDANQAAEPASSGLLGTTGLYGTQPFSQPPFSKPPLLSPDYQKYLDSPSTGGFSKGLIEKDPLASPFKLGTDLGK